MSESTSRHRTLPAALAIGAALALALTSGVVRAQVPCSSLVRPVYVSASNEVVPLVARVAPLLAVADGEERMTIVYQGRESCTAVGDVAGGHELTGSAAYFEPDGAGGATEHSCTLGPAARATLSLSDVSYRTCKGSDRPIELAETATVVQGAGFVVPPNSTQLAITAQEAFVLLKYGAKDELKVEPWSDPTKVIVPGPSTGTRWLVGLASGVAATQWSPVLVNVAPDASALVSRVAAENGTGAAEQTLGIVPLARYDQSRQAVRLLAFQAFGQSCLGAVYPDSTATATDKRNLRDGHYAVWSYVWALTRSMGGGDAEVAGRRLVSLLEGTAAAAGLDPVAEATRAGFVPLCAMSVRRSSDGGALRAWQPSRPCGCYFEKLATGSTNCEACGGGGSCLGGGTCSFGYCEKQP